MKVKLFKILVLIVLAGVIQPCVAQDTIVVISDYVEETTNGKVKIIQPEELRNRLVPKEIIADNKTEDSQVVGYRIQVFSDNNQRTAKVQAQAREHSIATRFPELNVYLIYKSPSWRVRVGDFRSRNDAEQVMYEIKEAFPAYANEVTLVVDKINIDENEF